MLLRATLLSLFALTPSAASQEAQRVLLESKSGEVTTLEARGLSLTDPRDREAWIVRPRGFSGGEGLLAAMQASEPVALRLVGGGSLHGIVLGGEGEILTMGLLGEVDLAVNILDIEHLEFPARIPKDRPMGRLEAAPEGDRLYRWTGREVDPIDGTVEEFTPTGIRFDSETVGSKLYEWGEIAELFVEVFEEEADSAGQAGVPIVLDLLDRSRLKGRLIRMQSTGCVVGVAGVEKEFPWAAIHEVAIDDGSLTYLSELPAMREEGRGAQFGDELGMVWDHRVDECVTGAPLRCGGETYRRGIGMHAPTRVTWALPSDVATLRGSIGIDDSALFNPRDAQGSVLFRILLDGEVAWESNVLRGGDSVVAIPAVALRGKRELTLEADMVGDYRGDRANWLRLLLVR